MSNSTMELSEAVGVMKSRLGEKLKLSSDVALRVFADLMLAAGAYAVALVVRFFVSFYDGAVGSGLLNHYMVIYFGTVWVLMFVVVLTNIVSGVYAKSRSYRWRYKAVVLVRSVSLSYLLFGFFAFLLPEQMRLPRLAVVVAWGLNVVLVLTSRLWSLVWKRLTIKEVKESKESNVYRQSDKTRVLVIGGAGYIGSALLPKLLEKGYSVRLLDLLLYGEEPISNVIDHPDLEIIQADFRQVDKVVEAMQQVDMVVHLGGLVGDPACSVDEDLTIEINLMATRMIAEIARGLGVHRFVFASTCSVYGASDEIVNERSRLNPVSLYARSKIASEWVLHELQNDRFSVVVLRFGTIYGLSGRTRFDLVVNLLTAKAVVEKKITLYGGDQWRPFVHVDDAALAVLKALEAPKALVHNQTFNVGSNDQNFTLADVADIIQKFVPAAEILELGEDGDRRNYRVDFGKIKKVLGYLPRWTVDDGVKQVIEAMKSGKVKDYRDPKYSNVKFLTADVGPEAIKQYYAGWEKRLITRTFDSAVNAG